MNEAMKALAQYKDKDVNLYDAGAFYVSEIRAKQIYTALNIDEMSENTSVESNLYEYLRLKEIDLELIPEYIELAKSIISEANANTPEGRLIGKFQPLNISVENYRSYREESFDFTQVQFAMVNGKNGIGKSSLFMDAICDCLYEAPREGELTGWICNDDSARSGSISFEFILGDTKWKVSRSRTKSGKITLNLAEEDKGKWKNRSESKTADTQKKIIDLLGMDCETFQSCVLIMQDKYGKFMEAIKEDRMAVLGSLIGLGQYENMHKLTKEKLTDSNREIRNLKTAIDLLKTKIVVKPELMVKLEQLEKQCNDLISGKDTKQELLNEVNSSIVSMEDKKEEINRLNNDLDGKCELVDEKEEALNTAIDGINVAQDILKRKDEILIKANEYESLKTEIALLNEKRNQADNILSEITGLKNDKEKQEEAFIQNSEKIEKTRKVLNDKDVISENANQYDSLLSQIDDMNKRQDQYTELGNRIASLQSEYRTYEVTSNAEISNEEKVIEGLNKKVEMLENSNCIDVAKAGCTFLEDAKKAQGSLPEHIEALGSLKEVVKAKIADYAKRILDLSVEQNNLGFDSEKLKLLKMQVKELQGYKDLSAKMEAYQENLNMLESREDEITSSIDDLQKKVEERRNQLKALELEVSLLDEKNTKLNSLKEFISLKEKVSTASLELEHGKNKKMEFDADISRLTVEINQVKVQIERLRQETAGLDDKKAHAQLLKKEVAELQDNENRINQSIGSINEKLKLIKIDEIDLAEKRKLLNIESDKSVKYQLLTEAFSQDGIPFKIVRSVVPELEAKANEILGQMTGGKMVLEMRTEKIQKSNKKEVNALDILIYDEHGILPYLAKSGGQKVKAALAVAFALANIKASRAGIQLGMLFVDEPPFMDSDGIEAYCDALETMHSRYPDMRILAISHDESMKARFPQQIEVYATENGSKIKAA